MELKRLSADDIEPIKSEIFDAFTGEPWNDEWKNPEQFHRYISGLISNANSLSLGLFEEERLVGAALGRIKNWYSGDQFWIDDLCIVSDCQGKGFGSQFLELIEDYLAKNGIKKIVLLTEREYPAYRFYAANGFTEKPNRIVYEKEVGNGDKGC